MGCESDVAKLQRLELEQMAACAASKRAVNLYGWIHDSLEYDGGRLLVRREVTDAMEKAAGLDTLAVHGADATSRCGLARRDYNRFMGVR